MASAKAPQPLILDKSEQITLTGLLLLLWDRDLQDTANGDCKRAREAHRNKLRFMRRTTAPDGKADHAPLKIEDPKVLKGRLGKIKSEADGLQLLIAACASQPWAEMDKPFNGELNSAVRERTLGWAARALPGKLSTGTVQKIDGVLAPTLPRRAWRRLRQPKVLSMIGIGAVAGVATAGVAAPAIGAAIGGTMGLSGAAATNAGLAAMGGGAIAKGGLGMAGGTAVIGSLGGVGGTGVGAMAGGVRSKDAAKKKAALLESQVLQLVALVNIGQELSSATSKRCLDQARLLEIEIGELIRRRAATRDRRKAEKLSKDLEQLLLIRRLMKPEFTLG